MIPFSLRPDLDRAVIDGFALALGIAPGQITPPTVGYTISYTAGHDDEPDTYSFYVAVSHERVSPILESVFAMLPDKVCAIVEISSRDAYRQTDVFLSNDEISKSDFLRTWRQWQPILLEDGSIAAGANSESPFIEIFVDQWKGLSIIVPLDMRDDVEHLLVSAGLEEVEETWSIGSENPDLEKVQIRPVLADLDGMAADIDDVLMELRHDWRMELNIDPDTNVDDAGRRLGMTLWHAVLGVHRAGDADEVADMSIWSTAGSLIELETLIGTMLEQSGEWLLAEVYSTDRIAFDERPDELSDLAPRRNEPAIHLISIEPRSDVASEPER